MADTRTALVTGARGQDGSYLTELLLEKGYCVVGASRSPDAARAHALTPRFEWIPWDPMDQPGMERTLASVQPDECYNLAASASGAGMYDQPAAMCETNGVAVVRMLEAIRLASPGTRFVQASSAEVFGIPATSPQSEDTIRRPRSPYGAAKQLADAAVDIYRQRYDLFAASAILYNHESPRRGPGFVSRKVTQAAARISLGLAERLSLGNLEASRDWGYAGDYARAMWLMLQADAPGDFVIATGTSHTVREMCQVAFAHVGLDYEDFVDQDLAAFRAAEPVPLLGAPDKARRVLGWQPHVDFNTLIEMMVDADLARLRNPNGSTGADA